MVDEYRCLNCFTVPEKRQRVRHDIDNLDYKSRFTKKPFSAAFPRKCTHYSSFSQPFYEVSFFRAIFHLSCRKGRIHREHL